MQSSNNNPTPSAMSSANVGNCVRCQKTAVLNQYGYCPLCVPYVVKQLGGRVAGQSEMEEILETIGRMAQGRVGSTEFLFRVFPQNPDDCPITLATDPIRLHAKEVEWWVIRLFPTRAATFRVQAVGGVVTFQSSYLLAGELKAPPRLCLHTGGGTDDLLISLVPDSIGPAVLYYQVYALAGVSPAEV